jgi:hypothetical protein
MTTASRICLAVAMSSGPVAAIATGRMSVTDLLLG